MKKILPLITFLVALTLSCLSPSYADSTDAETHKEKQEVTETTKATTTTTENVADTDKQKIDEHKSEMKTSDGKGDGESKTGNTKKGDDGNDTAETEEADEEPDCD